MLGLGDAVKSDVCLSPHRRWDVWLSGPLSRCGLLSPPDMEGEVVRWRLRIPAPPKGDGRLLDFQTLGGSSVYPVY